MIRTPPVYSPGELPLIPPVRVRHPDSRRSARFRPIYKQFFWIFLADCIVLGWVGANPVEGSFILIGRIATIYYFAHFLIILPLIGKFERTKPLPESIHQAVLAKKGGGDAGAAPPGSSAGGSS